MLNFTNGYGNEASLAPAEHIILLTTRSMEIMRRRAARRWCSSGTHGLFSALTTHRQHRADFWNGSSHLRPFRCCSVFVEYRVHLGMAHIRVLRMREKSMIVRKLQTFVSDNITAFATHIANNSTRTFVSSSVSPTPGVRDHGSKSSEQPRGKPVRMTRIWWAIGIVFILSCLLVHRRHTLCSYHCILCQ